MPATFPVCTVVGVVLALAVAALNLAGALQYDRGAIAAGQVWRIITGHFTHWSADHLSWDVAVFAVLGLLAERGWAVRRGWRVARHPERSEGSLVQFQEGSFEAPAGVTCRDSLRHSAPVTRGRGASSKMDEGSFAALAMTTWGRQAPLTFVPTLSGRGAFLLCVLASAAATSAGVWLLRPDLAYYRGLSGIDCALFALVTVSLAREGFARRDWSAAALAAAALAGFAAKTVVELATGAPLFVDAAAAGFESVALAHALGAAVGVIVGLLPVMGGRR